MCLLQAKSTLKRCLLPYGWQGWKWSGNLKKLGHDLMLRLQNSPKILLVSFLVSFFLRHSFTGAFCVWLMALRNDFSGTELT